ncbi:MAG: hypothetical protein R2727_05465 [Bacteroidales bacterium]
MSYNANDYNIIVDDQNSPGCYPGVAGFIDFGDAIFSWTISDLAVAIAYLMLDKEDPLSSALSVVKGYCTVFKISPVEADLLFILARMRLSISICMAASQQKERPR